MQQGSLHSCYPAEPLGWLFDLSLSFSLLLKRLLNSTTLCIVFLLVSLLIVQSNQSLVSFPFPKLITSKMHPQGTTSNNSRSYYMCSAQTSKTKIKTKDLNERKHIFFHIFLYFSFQTRFHVFSAM